MWVVGLRVALQPIYFILAITQLFLAPRSPGRAPRESSKPFSRPRKSRIQVSDVPPPFLPTLYLWRHVTAKVIGCRDVGYDCDGVVRAETEERTRRMAAEHARRVRGLRESPPEAAAEVRPVMRGGLEGALG